MNVFEDQLKMSMPEDIDAIINQVCASCRISRASLMSRNRDNETAWARHLAIYLTVKLNKYGEKRINEVFRRKHGTVAHSVAVVENRMATEKLIKEQVEGLLK